MCDCSSDWGMRVKKLVHSFDGPAANFGVPGALVAAKLLFGGLIERGQQIERDVGRLIICWVGRGDVMKQRPDRRLSRQRLRLAPQSEAGGKAASHQAGRDRFHVAFYT